VQGAHARLEFVEVEGLGQVVVGAGVQAQMRSPTVPRAVRISTGVARPLRRGRLLQHQQAVHARAG
jgi:hypothetical protein